MKQNYLVDTGPIVALLNSRDQYHPWACDLFESIEPPLATCEAVISEACFLVRGMKGGVQAVFGLLDRGVLDLSFRLEPHLTAVESLMAKYSSVPMSLADACLVKISELDPKAIILTLDSDFRVYRRNGRQVVPFAMPD
jgi:predicted nucleic acid-binding protein